jgi:hypothetical protein
MNYCSGAEGSNIGILTRKDIVGLQLVYGRKPAGSLTAAGMCMDVHNTDLGNGNHVQLWDCWGGLNQLWKWSPVDGTLRPEQRPDLCLDDASGGTAPGTPLDVWECDFRANTRWDFARLRISTLGNLCLELIGGESITRPCIDATSTWAYTDRGMFSRVGSNKCLDVSPGVIGHLEVRDNGEVVRAFQNGSPARLKLCDPSSPTQRFLLTEQGQLLSNGGCLYAMDGERTIDMGHGLLKKVFAVDDFTRIRLFECDDNNLAQKFSFKVILKSSGGNCVNRASENLLQNGDRLVLGNCESARHFLFNFADVEANLW